MLATHAAVALLTACDAPSALPGPRPDAVASSAIAPVAEPPARGSSDTPPRVPAATAAAAAAPDDSPACQKGPEHHGGWTPSTSDVAAIVPRLRDVDCGDPAWRRDALERCMKEQGQSSVIVRFEGVSQPGDRTFACSLGVTGAAWRGRHFLVVHDSYFQVPTAWGYTSVYELKRAEPVLLLDGAATHAPLCQGSSAGPSVAKPLGWSTFPKELQEVLCGR